MKDWMMRDTRKKSMEGHEEVDEEQREELRKREIQDERDRFRAC